MIYPDCLAKMIFYFIDPSKIASSDGYRCVEFLMESSKIVFHVNVLLWNCGMVVLKCMDC
jgi:hypothetical protein